MSTTARLTYYLPPADGSRAFSSINADSLTGKHPQNWLEDYHTVQVEDVRGKEGLYNLDNAGFLFHRHPAKHTAFLDDTGIEEEYYPESIELIKKLTGASRVVIFDHTIRRRRPGEVDNNPQKRQPVSLVHVDQTTTSSIARVHRHLPPNDATVLLRGRFQIINLWRPISRPAIDWPLTLCDCRSVDTKCDLVPVTLVYPDREGETYGVRHDPRHQWKYKSAMEPEDLVLIKCFDSVQDGSVAMLAPHTAFEDPKTPQGTPFRESIELRVLVFYE